MSDELLKISTSLKKAIILDDPPQAIQLLKRLVPLIQVEIDENRRTTSLIMVKKFENFKVAFFVLAKCIKNKIFAKISQSSELSNFQDQIRNILLIAPLLSGDDSFFQFLWIKAVKITTFLVDKSSLILWHVPIQRCFIAAPPLVNVLVDSQILTQRFQHMLSYITKRKLDSVQLWWEIISTSILSLFLSYPVISIKGDSLPANCIDGPCPELINENLIRFFRNSKVRSKFRLNRNSPTEAIALIHFFVQFSENIDPKILDWFFDLWIPLCTQNFESTEPYALLQIFKAISPSNIIDFMQLFARLIILRFDSQPKANYFELFDSLRFIWCHPLSKLDITEYLPKIIFAIYIELYLRLPPMASIVFLTFTFDYQSLDSQIWDFFNSRFLNGDKQFITCCKKFVSVLAITFAPLFFEFSESEVKSHFTKFNERNTRNKLPTLPIDSIMALFTNPLIFEEYIANDTVMQKDFSKIHKNNKVRFLTIELTPNRLGQEIWNKSKALKYVEALIGSFQSKMQPTMYVSFLSSLASVQELIPITIIKHRDFIWNHFIKSILAQLIISKPNLDIFYALAYSINFMNVSFKDSDENDILWVLDIIKFLTSKEGIMRFAAYRPGIMTLLKFVPSSFILIPFLISQFSLKIPPENDKYYLNFILSAFSFVSSDVKYNQIPEKLTQISSKWPPTWNNKQLIENSCEMIKNKSFLEMSLLNIIPKPGRNKIIDSSFLIPIFLNELFDPKKEQISQFLKENLPLSLIQEKGVNSRMFSFFREIRHLISMKQFPEFHHFLANNLSKVSNDFSFLTYCMENLEKTDLAVFLQNVKQRKNNRSNHKNIKSIIENIFPFIRYKVKPPISYQPENISANIQFDDKINISLELIDENEFNFVSRSFRAQFAYRIESFIHKDEKSDLLDNLSFPNENENETETKNKEDQEFQEFESNVFTQRIRRFFSNDNIPFSSKVISNSKEFDIDVEPMASPIKTKRKRHSLFDEENSSDGEESTSTYHDYFTSLFNCPASLSFVSNFSNLCHFSNFGNGRNKQSILNRYKICNNPSPSTQRNTISLLQSPFCEQIKIGVLFVSSTQFAQNDILANTMDTVSPVFKSFLCSLGENVDLSTHRWFNGKLNQRDGRTIFYRNSQMEVMFHVAPMLPDTPDDKQRLYKKRHIGNDNVHIVWCENPAGYDTSVIVSQFNDAHIVIYPTNGDLYRVAVHRKNESHKFYPLPHDSLVTKESLGFMVRTTAIVADRIVRREREDQPYINFIDIIRSLNSE